MAPTANASPVVREQPPVAVSVTAAASPAVTPVPAAVSTPVVFPTASASPVVRDQTPVAATSTATPSPTGVSTQVAPPTSSVIPVVRVQAKVSAGALVACAVIGGAATCWGDNQSGALGSAGKPNAGSGPQRVAGLAAGVTALSTGGGTTCAVARGGAWCWGSNDVRMVAGAPFAGGGHLGSGASGPGTDSAAPVAVKGLSAGVSAISVGQLHACAIVSGAAWCWGSNVAGQLGSGKAGAESSTAAPVRVEGLTSGVTAISAGGLHTCAIVGGAAKCWGANSMGQLGDDSTANRTAPTQVSGLATGVTAVSAGSDHTCAIVTGVVRCWGSNASGQLGDRSQVDHSTPVPVAGLTAGVSAISAGDQHTCAIASGAAYCWGFNQLGQLGDGTKVDRQAPVRVAGLPEPVTDISAGGYFTCAVADSAVACWGSNYGGQVGTGSVSDPVLTPTFLEILAPMN